jgi:hypothetical protein
MAYVINPRISLADAMLIIGKVNETMANVLFTCKGPRNKDDVVLSIKSGNAYTCVPPPV